MTEDFLHHIWQFKLFEQRNIKTENGEPLEILKSGDHNTDAGPDFFNAKLKIGATEWAGNVEIHLLSSDWKKHHHQQDKAYSNIILHVVFENDEPVYRAADNPIPTLVLKNLIDPTLLSKYEAFKQSSDWIPCASSIQRVPEFLISSWLERVLVERIESKSSLILANLKLNKNNWEETFYQHLASNFGFKTNAVPFELLAKSISNSLLSKHKNSLLQIEALLFGNSGLLEQQYLDTYLHRLQNEYYFLKNKYGLKPLEAHLWKFLRLRPGNFPTVRIAQFAMLIHQSEHLFSKILEVESLKELRELLAVSASSYWDTHYIMDKASISRKKYLGPSAIDILLINTILPFVFIYGKQKQEEHYMQRALALMEKIKAEKNSIIEKFEELGLKPNNAHRTQALLQLKKQYCNSKRCLQCAIGNNLLKK